MDRFPTIYDAPVVAYDTETTGLTAADRAFGLSVAVPGWSAYYDLRREPQAARWFEDQMRRLRGVLVAHNASFDYRMAHNAGIKLPADRLDDTVIRGCLIDEHIGEYSLDTLCKIYLGRGKATEIYDKLSQLFGGRPTRNAQMSRIADAPAEVVEPYAIVDAERALELWLWQEREIDRQKLRDICDFERSVMPALISMGMHGIRVDLNRAAEAQKRLTIQIDDEQRQLNELVGRKFNVNSSPQVRTLFKPRKEGRLWVADNDIECGETEGGQPSINSAVLHAMEDDRRAQLILSIRSLLKTRDTFLGKHVIASAIDDRVYPTINQTRGESAGTVTGRLSYTNPAMQQIPSRNKAVAAIVKPVFLPDEGQIWVDGDMASFEVRVFAHLINDPKVNEQYRDDPTSDFHQMVADMTGLPRNATYSGQANSKQLNLSMIFNSGNGAIAAKMGMPYEWTSFESDDGEIVTYRKPGAEAMRVINLYHSRLPGVKALAERASEVAGMRGYVRTQYGRRLRFPNKRFLYKASGLLIQATAADINKEVIKRLCAQLIKHDSRLLLNTHDSYSMSMPADRSDAAWREIEHSVREWFPWFRVPLIMELSGKGTNWWEAVK